MTYTDEQVKSVAEAYRDHLWRERDKPEWDDMEESDKTNYMNSARRWMDWTLEAVQPTESLEDVLGRRWAVVSLHLYEGTNGYRGWIALVKDMDEFMPRDVRGDGSTPEEAIRAAVKAATDEA